MTTIPAVEEYIRDRGLNMTTPALVPIPAHPLSPDQRRTLQEALETALGSARQRIRDLLDFENWSQNNSRASGPVEMIADNYVNDLQNAIKAVGSIQVMIATAKGGQIVVRADA